MKYLKEKLKRSSLPQLIAKHPTSLVFLQFINYLQILSSIIVGDEMSDGNLAVSCCPSDELTLLPTPSVERYN